MWHWHMTRCWQWVAGRLPVSQFTWRFIKHFGQDSLERVSLVKSDLRPKGYCNVFTWIAPTMGEGSAAGQRSRGIVKRSGKGRRWIGLCRVSPTSLSLYLSSSLMTNGSSCNLLSIQTGSQLFLCLPFVPMLWQASKLIKLCPRIWHYSVLPSICWLLLIFFDTSFKNQ